MRDYVSRLHVVGIAMLAVLTVGLALVGWSLRPASGGYPELDSNMTVRLDPSVPGGDHLAVTQSLTRMASGSTLVLHGDFSKQASHWSVDFFHLDEGWRLCTPTVLTFTGGGAVSVAKLPPQHVNLKPRYATVDPFYVNPVEVDGGGPFYVKLCWSEGGPVQTNGAYLSARFIAVTVATYGDEVNPTRQLNVGEGTTADYSIQSSVQPNSVFPGFWQWNALPAADAALAVSALNASGIQHDSYDAFLSGILFGVAGGALVGLLTELVAPFRSRKERQAPGPSG